MVTIISERNWGEPKLVRPDFIKKEGFERIDSVVFSKVKCPTYKKGDRIVIKHRDWFSPSISIPKALSAGIIDKVRQKFVYNDNFGSVVLRSEAWIEVRNIKKLHNRLATEMKLVAEIAEACGVDKFSLLSSHDWNYFAEQIIKKLLLY